ncbi:MAG: hypothetical protein JOZ04_07550 [Acidimicrobiia bacterium]|nr:hypothetical protein [Acidimicrobiia bacterium]
MIVVLVPVGVGLFVGIHRHYTQTDARLTSLRPHVGCLLLGPVRAIGDASVEDAALRWAARVGLAPRTERPRPTAGADPLVVPVVARSPGPFRRAIHCGDRRARAQATVTVTPKTSAGLGDRHVVVVLVERPDAVARYGLEIARRLSATEVHAVLLDVEREATDAIVDHWPVAELGEVEVLAAPYREAGGPLRWKADQLFAAGTGLVTVVVPRVATRWWQRPLYHDPGPVIRRALCDRDGAAVLEVRLAP